MDKEMYLVPPSYYEIQPHLMADFFRKYLAIRPRAKGDLVCLFGQVSVEGGISVGVNILHLAGVVIPFLKLSPSLTGKLEKGDVVYLITANMAPSKTQKVIRQIIQVEGVEKTQLVKSRKWTTNQAVNLHWLTGKVSGGSVDVNVDAGLSIGDEIELVGIQFKLAAGYAFKLSTHSLQNSDIAWFNQVDNELQGRFNNLLGLERTAAFILQDFIKVVLELLDKIRIAIGVRKISFPEAGQKIKELIDELKGAETGTYYYQEELLTEEEKTNEKNLLNWLLEKQQETQSAFAAIAKKYNSQPQPLAKKEDDDFLFFKKNQSGIVQTIDGYVQRFKEAIEGNPGPIEEGKKDTCYLEVKRYNHQASGGANASLSLSTDNKQFGVTAEALGNVTGDFTITKSCYQTYVEQSNLGETRKLILTQSNRVNYKKIQVTKSLNGVMALGPISGGTSKGISTTKVINAIEYRSASIYWSPSSSSGSAATVEPLPGSGISFGTSIALADLAAASSEANQGNLSPNSKTKIQGYAQSLRLTEGELIEFLKQLGSEMKKEAWGTMMKEKYQMVLIESAYRFVDTPLTIKVKDPAKNILEEIRDVPLISTALTNKKTYKHKMEDAGLKLESIMLRLRIDDNDSSSLPTFTLGGFVQGSGASLTFTGNTQAGNQGIINFSPFFFKDMPAAGLSEEEKIDQAVPPVFLVPHTL